MDVSIIIVNYNTCRLLFDCLKSVKEKTHGIRYEVIVIDNASQDGSCKMIEKEYPWVNLIESKENLGFGKANNLGLKYSSGKYLFLLNSDTLLINNAIKILYEFMENHPNVVISGGQLYDANMKKVQSYMWFLPSILGEMDALLRGSISKIFSWRQRNKDCFRVGYITGADMMIRKDKLENSLFDTDYFMYFEETDLTRRLKEKGDVVCVPSSKIIHLEGKSFKNIEKRARWFLTSRKLYFSKHHNQLYYDIVNIIYKVRLKLGEIINILRKDKSKTNYYKIYRTLLKEIS